MGQWRKSSQRWLSSGAILTFVLLAPTRAAALGQGNSDFGHSHKPSDPGNSDFDHSHKPSDPGNRDFGHSDKPSDPGNRDFPYSDKPSDPGNREIGQNPSIPTPEPATLILLALGGGTAALGARFRKGRRK